MTSITIDMSELKVERNNLSSFLESKTQVPITIEGKMLIIDSKEETLSTRNVKTYVKRFLYHRGLYENYRVTEEHDASELLNGNSGVLKGLRRGEQNLRCTTHCLTSFQSTHKLGSSI